MAFNVSTVGFYLLLLVGAALFAAVAGMLSSWVDRKVTALVQARRGPPLLQPFYDFFKLMGKENVRPLGAAWTYSLMPLVALAAVSLAAAILLGQVLWQNGLLPGYGGGSAHGLVGDLIVVLYLLAVPSLALVLGASASNNPFASVGASREMKLMSYELPLLLAVATALALAAASERRFVSELQRQTDLAVIDDDSPLMSVQRRLRNAQAETVELYARSTEPKKARELRRLWIEFRIFECGGRSAALKAAQERLQAAMDAIEAAADKDARARIERQQDKVNRLGRKVPGGGPLTARLPLRFDALLGLRGAGPEPLSEVLLVRGRDELGAAAARAGAGIGAEIEKDQRLLSAVRRDLRATEQEKSAGDEGRIRISPERARELDAGLGELGRMRQDAEARLDRDEARKKGLEDDAGRVSGALNAPRLEAAARLGGPGRLAEIIALALCVAVAVLCAQAKLGLVPFDCAEAETEIAGGVLIEYGGPLLGIWKLARHMLLFLLPAFIGVVFMGGFRFFVPGGELSDHLAQAGVSLLKYVGILVVFVLVRNTNPRVRIDQAMRFFLGPLTLLAVLALVLALAVYADWLG